MPPKPHRPPTPSPGAGILDWLALVEPDGAFLTPTELRTTFPHGFDPLPSGRRAELRARFDDASDDAPALAALRRWLLADLLEWGEQLLDGQQIPAALRVTVTEHGVDLVPDHALDDTEESGHTRLGVFVWPPGTELDRKPPAGTVTDTWSATPIQRAEKWCREAGVALALVTDDDWWVLVWAPRGATSASCRWRLADLVDERVLQAGLVSLLGSRRFFSVSNDPKSGETIERLFERAVDAELEVTKGLGRQVRRAVELVVASMSRAHVGSGEQLLATVSDVEVYEAAVTLLMRLLFLLFAEERRLLPSEDPLWAESYSVLSLRDQLRVVPPDELEDRSSAWHRLLAAFRAVHGGVRHDRLSLPAYGGALFDPARFPFLEGRQSGGDGTPIGIDDRTILAVLDALLTVEVGRGTRKVAQRLSYKALDVEQIGHCYEGLLDHGCAPVEVLALGLVGPEADEPEITVEDLVAHLDLGSDVLCEWLADKTRCHKSISELSRLLGLQPVGLDLAKLRVACGSDDHIAEQVRPFWGLIRADLRGLPVVLLPGSKYVTQTSTRRNTGAQYTTKALAEEVVQYALEPLVYEPGPQNEPDPAKWALRRPAEILNLRVCDPAVGSGAILTAAGRYLADRLIESVTEHGAGDGPFASRLADLGLASTEDQLVLARREVVDHCLYGVDKNPIAAEMAKLSLWLTTMARERPFTFLDHAIQLGDSLLGITDVDQLRWLHPDPSKRKGAGGFATLALDARLSDAAEVARRLQALSVLTVRDAAEKQHLHDELRGLLADLSVVADSVVGAALSTSAKGARVSFEDRLAGEDDRIRAALDDEHHTEAERMTALVELEGRAAGWLRIDLPSNEVPTPWERQCLHWPLRFPEVFLPPERTGFDAMVANPPFLGGKRISGANGAAYREHLVSAIADGATGNADLVTYFILRMCRMSASVGTLATNTVSQGDTREVGIDRLTTAGWTIQRAVKSAHWPNDANLEIAKLWLWNGSWNGRRTLEGVEVKGISTTLDVQRRVMGPAERLSSNSGKSFIGCALNTTSFILTEEEARDLLAADARNAEVVQPYLNGQDLNDDPQQLAARWAVTFADWSEERASQYVAPFELLKKRVKPEVMGKEGYPGWAKRWWQFWRPREDLYTEIAGMDRVLAIALTSKLVLPAFESPRQVFSHATAVFPYDDDGHFGVLTSTFHWWWALAYSSTMRSDIRYTPSDVFETFAQPQPQVGPPWVRIADAGRHLNEFRAEMMVRTRLGLTKTYNRVHDPVEQDPSITRLRELHTALDYAVRDAYGWSDLELDHHHWETAQGMRFTVGPAAKDEVLDRLLELNHERHAAEVAAGLHDSKRKTATPAKKRPAESGQSALDLGSSH